MLTSDFDGRIRQVDSGNVKAAPGQLDTVNADSAPHLQQSPGTTSETLEKFAQVVMPAIALALDLIKICSCSALLIRVVLVCLYESPKIREHDSGWLLIVCLNSFFLTPFSHSSGWGPAREFGTDAQAQDGNTESLDIRLLQPGEVGVAEKGRPKSRLVHGHDTSSRCRSGWLRLRSMEARARHIHALHHLIRVNFLVHHLDF